MELHSSSGQQLPLPLGADDRGPEEVVLPFTPDDSADYGTPRLKGSFSTRVDEVVAPRKAAPLVIEGERFFAKVIVRGQSYEAAGTVVARDVRPFGEPDAEPQHRVERVDVHAAKRYVNGAYYRCDLTAELERAAARAVRDHYDEAYAASTEGSRLLAA